VTVRILLAHELRPEHFPPGEHGDYARRWWLPFSELGASPFIANVLCQLGVVIAEQLVFPITISSGYERGNAYVVSPYTHYVSYLREELRLVESRAARAALAVLLDALGAVLERGLIDRVVTVNNWLLSTNLYPRSLHDALPSVVDALRNRFPHHAVMFRSLNEVTTGQVMMDLHASGFQPLVSRRVYLFDSNDDTLFKRKGFRRDHALIVRHGYRVVPVQQADVSQVERIVALYNALYLDKYSRYNPAFTPAFVALAIREQLLHVFVLEKDGRRDGVMGFFVRDGIMTTPLLGYDTSLPAELGLYRMLTALLSQLARERGLFLHRSSGAATFKRSRGAMPALEYSMVDFHHLTVRRQVAWKLLLRIANQVGRPLLEKYDR
jgi:hypothetical protein